MKVARSVVFLALAGLPLAFVKVEAANATNRNHPSNETPSDHPGLRRQSTTPITNTLNSNLDRGLYAKRQAVKICRSLSGQIYDQCVAFCKTHHCGNRRRKSYSQSCQRIFDTYIATAGEFPPCTDVGGVFNASWPATHFLNLTEHDFTYNLSVSVTCDEITSPAVRTVVQTFIDQSPFPSLTCDELGVLAVYGPRDLRDIAAMGSVWCTSAMFYTEVLRFCDNKRRRLAMYISPRGNDEFSGKYELDWANEMIKSMVDKGIIEMAAGDHQKFSAYWLAPGTKDFADIQKGEAYEQYPGRDCSGQPYPECYVICCALHFYAGLPARCWRSLTKTASWAVLPCEDCAARVKERGPCPSYNPPSTTPPIPPPPPPTLKPTVKPAKPTPCKAANGYKGTCLGATPCLAKGDVPIANPSCGNLHCCIDGDAFAPNACVSDETFIGECKSRSDCVAKHRSPLKGFATPGHACGGATAFCCVSPPVCESMTEGNPKTRITGTCIDKSGCKKQLVSKPGPPWMCPGDDDIQCCMDLPHCSVNGVSGQCTDKTLCVGPNLAIHDNLCPGDEEIKCCITLPPAPTNPPTNPPTKPPTEPHTGAFTQIGQTLVGTNDCYGSVALSADGIVVAIGCPKEDFFRVFSYDADQMLWTFRFSLHLEATSRFGASVAVSGNGVVVAVGGPFNSDTDSMAGCIRVYDYNGLANDDVKQVGNVIYGSENLSYFGGVVAISLDGKTVAGGQVDFDVFPGKSCARVFTLNPVTQTWDQLGQVLRAKDTADFYGSQLALASDGRTVAVGGWSRPSNDYSLRYYQVYRYEDTSKAWSQIGQDIFGEIWIKDGDAIIPQHCVSLSGAGTTLAFGNFRIDEDGASPQRIVTFVRVLEFRQNTQTWIELGNDIDVQTQEATGSEVGFFLPSVALSSDGKTVSTGSEHDVRMFRYDQTNVWLELGAVAGVSDGMGQLSAIEVVTSSDGSIVAAGVPLNDETGKDAGHVHVFSYT